MTLEVACAILVLVGVLAVVYRVIAGPTLPDRILAVNVIGTKTIVVLCLIGFIYDRPAMFLDIALVYALINFVATVAVLRYMEGLARRRGEHEAAGEGGPA
ncbi:MAG: monovalent cation/H+ antiporter complex subunit F [Planctomycetota bacterium]